MRRESPPHNSRERGGDKRDAKQKPPSDGIPQVARYKREGSIANVPPHEAVRRLW